MKKINDTICLLTAIFLTTLCSASEIDNSIAKLVANEKSSIELETPPYSFMSDEELLEASYDNDLARDALIHRFFNCDGDLDVIHNLSSINSLKLVKVIWKGPMKFLSFEQIYFIINLPHKDLYERRRFYDTGLQYLIKFASEGKPNPAYIYIIGTLYENEKHTRQNYAEATKYYKAAANMGFPAAQRAYGGMYEDGTGAAQNNKRAAKW